MHAGKPVVASRSGGIPELIDHGVTGVLVNNEPEEIADAIIALLEQPEKARAMGVKAQVIAQSRFTWERVAADFATLYGAAAEPAAGAARSQVFTLVD
jgi:glycosyltransferase involved in cell wall biosynthesis